MVLHHDFISIAKQDPKKIAIIDKTRDSRVTYDKALIASLIFAHRFKHIKDKYVGVMVPSSAAAFLTILGLLMQGKVPVFINYSTGAEQNCRYAQDRCGFKTILTSKALVEKINCSIIPGMIFLEDISESLTKAEKLRALLHSKLKTGMIINSLPKVTEDDNAAILFTSGSENDPKAVQLTHKNICTNVHDLIEVFDLVKDDIVLLALPIFHVFGLTTGFWVAMLLNGSVVTCANPLEFKKIPTYIREEKVTLVPGTPAFFSAYLREAKLGDFESVRIMVPGADKTPDWLQEAYRQKHNLELLEGYGTTETSPVIATNTLTAHRIGSVGRVMPSVRVKIVDVNTGAELDRGEDGKILVKGDSVMKGYFDDIESTSMRIRDGWYDTGDMGMLDEDDFLWHRGRLKRFVKIGGEMVSMVKIENVLEQLVPTGVDVCVVEIPDSRKGARLVAVVTGHVHKHEIIKKMGKQLPQIAIPKKIIMFPELPKMGSGKVDFRSVTKMVRAYVSS